MGGLRCAQGGQGGGGAQGEVAVQAGFEWVLDGRVLLVAAVGVKPA